MIGSSMHNAKLAARIRVRIAMMVHTDKLRYVQVVILTCDLFSSLRWTDGRPAEYRWRPLCKSSVIPFLVPRHNVRLTPAAGVPCSNDATIGERKT